MMPFLFFAVALSGAAHALDVQDWIAANRPTVLTWKDFDRQLVETMKPRVESIGVIYGNFYSKDTTDAAILSEQDGDLIFEIITCGSVCRSVFHKDLSSGTKGIRFVAKGLTYLTLIPKGALVESSPAVESEDKHVRLKRDAVQLATFGKAAMVWYWDDDLKTWETVSTSD